MTTTERCYCRRCIKDDPGGCLVAEAREALARGVWDYDQAPVVCMDCNEPVTSADGTVTGGGLIVHADPAACDNFVAEPEYEGCECEQDWRCHHHRGLPTWLETRYDGYPD